ncbi:hypothetical protein ABTX34_16880 [Streptomyces sp. NPDC096538]|uniref:hypothetical protein n=1 Tax=Streptomyces sp. NPDC096538 TaxID=3155427 RepID=UPI003325FBF0
MNDQLPIPSDPFAEELSSLRRRLAELEARLPHRAGPAGDGGVPPLPRQAEPDPYSKAHGLHPKKQLIDYEARVAAGEPVALAIKTIAGRYGWQVGDSHRKAYIAAVEALEHVYQLDAQVLDDTLATLTDAWGHPSEAVHAPILRGLGMVLNRHGDDVNRSFLVEVLRRFPDGPRGLLATARRSPSRKKVRLANCVAHEIVAAYNAPRLPDWTAEA